jgi:hypothetical protein
MNKFVIIGRCDTIYQYSGLAKLSVYLPKISKLFNGSFRVDSDHLETKGEAEEILYYTNKYLLNNLYITESEFIENREKINTAGVLSYDSAYLKIYNVSDL